MKDVLKAIVYGGLFLVPFLTLYVANDFFFPFITGKNFAFRIIVEITFASWAVLALLDRAYRPRFSWILTSFGVLIVVMFFANLFGEYPLKSFWSNFERMDGYVTLAHLFLYFLTLGSVFTDKKTWSIFLHTTVAVAFLVALYGLAQYAGVVEGYRGRIDSRLGNAAYMAVYMLFHIFIIFYLFLQTNVRAHRILYGIAALTFILTLVETGTRGTAIALVAGLIVATAYVGLFGIRFKEFRKYALGVFAVLLIGSGIFFSVRDSEMVQGNPNLARIANISISDLTVRATIWGMAYEGVKERPILGWGQGNFNYVFNKYYEPSLHSQEQWFDRVHNIFFDWLIAGGIIGFLAYFGILFAALYYLFWQPLFTEEHTFNVLERGVLIGLLAGYFTHNLVVFDNIVSYIFYGTILALIHSRVSTEIPAIRDFKLDTKIIEQIVAPVTGVALILVVYFVNIPGIQAAGDLIDALRTGEAQQRVDEFKQALSRNSFANQEIREQLTQQVQGIIRAAQVPDEFKQSTFKFAEEELLKQIKEKPGDARVHVFIASFYRFTNNSEKAEEQLLIARELSPRKIQIIFEQALTHLQKQERDKAFEYFKEAYELAPDYPQGRIFYALGGMYMGQPEIYREVIEGDERLESLFARNDLALQATFEAKEYDLLLHLFGIQIKENPNDPQRRVNLAVIYHESGETEKAIEVLKKAVEDIPSFKEQGESFIADLEGGRAPGAPRVEVEGQEVDVQVAPTR